MNDAPETIIDSGETVLVFGSTGWIGSQMVALLSTLPNVRVVCGKARIENLPDVCAEVFLSPALSPPLFSAEADATQITDSGAQYVVNAAAVIGFPNVNAIESRKQETLLFVCPPFSQLL